MDDELYHIRVLGRLNKEDWAEIVPSPTLTTTHTVVVVGHCQLHLR